MKNRKPQTSTPIYIRTTSELRVALDARARAERRTVRAVVEAALAAYLQTQVTP